jgi:hypothetical protein
MNYHLFPTACTSRRLLLLPRRFAAVLLRSPLSFFLSFASSMLRAPPRGGVRSIDHLLVLVVVVALCTTTTPRGGVDAASITDHHYSQRSGSSTAMPPPPFLPSQRLLPTTSFISFFFYFAPFRHFLSCYYLLLFLIFIYGFGSLLVPLQRFACHAFC